MSRFGIAAEVNGRIAVPKRGPEPCVTRALVRSMESLALHYRDGTWRYIGDLLEGRDLRSPEGLSSHMAFCVQTVWLALMPGISSSEFRLGMSIFHEAARELSGREDATLFWFNDCQRTTQSDIEELLDKAAEIAARRL